MYLLGQEPPKAHDSGEHIVHVVREATADAAETIETSGEDGLLLVGRCEER